MDHKSLEKIQDMLKDTKVSISLNMLVGYYSLMIRTISILLLILGFVSIIFAKAIIGFVPSYEVYIGTLLALLFGTVLFTNYKITKFKSKHYNNAGIPLNEGKNFVIDLATAITVLSLAFGIFYFISPEIVSVGSALVAISFVIFNITSKEIFARHFEKKNQK